MNRFAAFALILLAGPAAAQVGDAATGEALFAPCVACHGADGAGNADLNAPAIAGQEDWYVLRQLQNFKSGIRGVHGSDPYGVLMTPMVQALAEEDFGHVAAYVASLPPVPVATNLDGDAAAGEALYAPCVACHGADAKGNKEFNAPNLTLQQDWYVVRQLQYFKDGIRGTHPSDITGMQMAALAQTLTDSAAFEAVTAYLMTLR